MKNQAHLLNYLKAAGRPKEVVMFRKKERKKKKRFRPDRRSNTGNQISLTIFSRPRVNLNKSLHPESASEERQREQLP